MDRRRLLENGRANISAAHKLAMGNEYEAITYLGPTMLLLGFGIEVFLKAVLLDKGKEKDVVRKFGHDLWAMWNDSDLASQREQAQLKACECHHHLVEEYTRPQDRAMTDPEYIPNIVREVPEPGTFLGHLEDLSKLHSRESGFALRYPIKNEMVPEPMLLICVFKALIENYRDDSEIVNAP